MRVLTDDTANAAIAVSIITLAHNLNLHVIAKGVETEQQWSFLKEHGCDEAQGLLQSPLARGSDSRTAAKSRHFKALSMGAKHKLAPRPYLTRGLVRRARSTY